MKISIELTNLQLKSAKQSASFNCYTVIMLCFDL